MASRRLIVFLNSLCWYFPLSGLLLGWHLANPSVAQDAPALVAPAKPQAGPEKVIFDRDIRPILSDKCYFCHGPDANKRAADLRLDNEESAKATAIVVGKPDESELIKRILSSDPDLRMPPPASKLALSNDEKQKLQRWIEQGAEYSKHWAFSSLDDSIIVPRVKSVAWCKNEIDRFVLERLEQAGLPPSNEADRATLIRRLTLDLTGLPPTPDEIDDFLSDARPTAYEHLVDRLLASERYGERMAIEWLDLARYADTYGYQNDRYRAMWPWRDWVVDAFNQNLSYDQFITWQLAGDLLPNATREQILATAFNRNHRQTNEGGSVEEEFRQEYIADRVNTFGAAFLGLTLECCRCHDHKYDPLTQRDYYQFAAFFNCIDESGLYSHFTQATPTPTLQLSTAEQNTQLEELRASIQSQEAKLQGLAKELAPQFSNWQAAVGNSNLNQQIGDAWRGNLIGDYPFESLEKNRIENRWNPELAGTATEDPVLIAGKVGNGLMLSGENSVTFKTGGDFTRDSAFSVSLWLNSPKNFERAVVFHRSKAWTDSGSRGYELLIEHGKLSVGLIHFYPGNALRIVAKEPLKINTWTHVTVTYDGSSRASGVTLYVDGRPIEVDIVRDQLTRQIQGEDGANVLTIGQRFRDVGFKDGLVDEFKVFNRDLTALEVAQLHATDIGQALEVTAQEGELREFFLRTQSAEFKAAVSELGGVRKKFSDLNDPIPEIMVMREMAEQRPTHVLVRGAYDAPGDLVTRGAPDTLLAMRADQPRNRLGLAQWLVDPLHPLTARVAVNRLWSQFFGRGIVITPEDFGLQGEDPTHPELLDYLSKQFIASGWNVKQLVKSIVMSTTYRQQSNPTPDLLREDPENRLLARGPSHRLSAEMIRDVALAASGLLVEELGGAPVKPYQPEGLWEEKSGEKYQRDEGSGSHRRSLYTFWKRTSPPPSMMSFDAVTREVCTVRRQTTLTPLQVLVLLNDPQFVEAARALAERAMLRTTEQPEQIRLVFRSLTGRTPSDPEQAILLQLFNEQLAEFRADSKRVEPFLKIGDHKINDQLAKDELAALTVVAEGLLSYDETVMKR